MQVVTIAQVAKEAGVSVATVSRVISLMMPFSFRFRGT